MIEVDEVTFFSVMMGQLTCLLVSYHVRRSWTTWMWRLNANMEKKVVFSPTNRLSDLTSGGYESSVNMNLLWLHSSSRCSNSCRCLTKSSYHCHFFIQEDRPAFVSSFFHHILEADIPVEAALSYGWANILLITSFLCFT